LQNPTLSIDPNGRRSFVFGAGKVCIQPSCNSPAFSGYSMLGEEALDSPNPIWEPIPGNDTGSTLPIFGKARPVCYEVDGISRPDGSMTKIPDNCTITISCDGGCPTETSDCSGTFLPF